MLGVGVKQSPNHPLILRIVLLSFGLEEFDTTFAQSKSDLYSLVLKYQVLGPGKKISYDLGVSAWFARVLYFRAHISAFPFANSPRQKCELRRSGTQSAR